MSDKPAHHKIASILAEVGPLPKRGSHGQQGYRYVTGDDLLDHLRPLMAKHGVILVAEPSELKQRDIKTKNGGYMVASVAVDCRLVDVDTGQEIVKGKWTGEAQDGDKAWKICVGYAVDAFLTTTFMVTGSEAPIGETRPAPDAHATHGYEDQTRPAQSSGGRRSKYPPNPLNDKLKALVRSGTTYQRLTEVARDEFGFAGDKIVKATDEVKRQVLAYFGQEA